MKVKVDFDTPSEPKKIVFAGPGDTLETEGLANCIGVVAADTQGRGAVMCHYDTVRAFDSDAPRVKGEPLKFKDAELRAFKREMEDELRRQIQDPAANVSVTVGLGISPPPGLQEAVENAFEMKAIQTDGTMSCEVPQGPRQRQTQYGTFSLGPVEPQEGVGAKRETVGQQRAREKEELLQKEQKRQAAGFSAKPSEPKQGTGCSIM